MEIEKNQAIHIDAYVNQVHDKDKAGASDSRPEKTTAKTDTVVISESAKRVQEVRKQLDAIPDIREEKVAQLKEQVENGTYQVNAEKVAEKMIKEGLINDMLK